MSTIEGPRVYRSRGLIRFLFHVHTHIRGIFVVRKSRTLGMGLFGFDQLVEDKREKEREGIRGSVFVQI